MVRIAPVRLTFNPKTLWFDAGDMELNEGEAVVVSTARGDEFGYVADSVFDMDYEETKKLKTPLKPVKRIAEPSDIARNDELAALSFEALPIFRRLSAETVPDMNPVAVEYLFEGDKAVFYFDAEDRVDFRDLVRKLAAELNIRVDMKQIGVRDGARLVGGLGHCGQEFCCRRLGGEFNPVSIRMAKEQDLSLNPQKISGVCGRLMCCLRYEYDAYKDFHSRAPKKNARIETPDGEGRVVEMDVPREIISIKVEEEKPVKVPLADMEPASDGARPNAVGQEAWEAAQNAQNAQMNDGFQLFSGSQLSGEDTLAKPGHIRHTGQTEQSETKQEPSKGRRRRNRGSKNEQKATPKEQNSSRSPRRRSTTLNASGETQTETSPKTKKSESRSTRKRGSNNTKGREASQNAQKSVKVGRNSSGIRSVHKNDESTGAQNQGGNSGRKRRRSHRASEEG